jgi:hypothetical protein
VASARSERQTPGTRAKDTDRNDTCQILDSALSEGQLSMEEHRQRVSTATNATTLGQLQNLVADLQTRNSPVQLPDLRKPSRLRSGGGAGGPGWGLRAAVAAVLVLLGMGIGWGLYGNTSSPLSFTTDPGAKSDGIEGKVLTPPKQLHSLGGLNGLIEQMKQRFGDTTGYRLLVYPDYASFDRADPGDERRKLDYAYRGGWDDPSTSAKSDSDRLVDVAAFDVKEIVAVLRGAPETVGIKPQDVTGTYLIIDPADDPTAPEAISLSIHVSSEFGSGYIELAPDGTPKRVTAVGD